MRDWGHDAPFPLDQIRAPLISPLPDVFLHHLHSRRDASLPTDTSWRAARSPNGSHIPSHLPLVGRQRAEVRLHASSSGVSTLWTCDSCWWWPSAV